MSKFIIAALAMAAAVALPQSAAFAATTVDVSTGRGSGPLDGNWLVGGPGIVNSLNQSTIRAATIPVGVASVWVGGATNSGINGARWITPASPGTATQPFGLYVYSTVFNLSNIGQLSDILLSGTFWADNQVFSIMLNEAPIYFASTFDPLAQEFRGGGTSFGASSNFRVGANRLVFSVLQGPGNEGNPTGLLVSAAVTAVPEPGTWLLMLLGFGAIGFAMRSRQTNKPQFLPA